MNVPKGYKIVEYTEVKRMPVGSTVYVGEVKRAGNGLKGLGVITPCEVGRRNCTVVAYTLPYKSTYFTVAFLVKETD